MEKREGVEEKRRGARGEDEAPAKVSLSISVLARRRHASFPSINEPRRSFQITWPVFGPPPTPPNPPSPGGTVSPDAVLFTPHGRTDSLSAIDRIVIYSVQQLSLITRLNITTYV